MRQYLVALNESGDVINCMHVNSLYHAGICLAHMRYYSPSNAVRFAYGHFQLMGNLTERFIEEAPMP
jgi:Zn-dependent M16 (insulinase) family peptidase